MANFNIDYLIVAGGGGAGASGANGSGSGGGGAGGLLTSIGSTTLTLNASVAYDVIVGAGGSGAVSVVTPRYTGGNNGSDSEFSGTGTTITAIGGGGGGSGNGSGSNCNNCLPNAGGSGGGTGYGGPGAAGTAGQGNNGGISASGAPYAASGGGGAGGAGSGAPNNSTGGNGGLGLTNSITVASGTGPFYAGGGGGSSSYNGTGVGGSGGSGIGGYGTSGLIGGDGSPNTGSGGGAGSSSISGNSTGGDGSSGIVVLRYTTADVASYTTTGLTPTEDTTTIPGQTILSFTTVGTGTITFTTPTPPTFSGTKVTTPVTDFNKFNTEEGLKIPSGTSSNQPTGVDGMVRNDTTQSSKGSASAITYYNGTDWRYFENELNSFNTVLYTGNGADKTITDVGFQPDLVWVKSTGTAHNVLFDSVRGAGKRLISNLTIAEDTGDNYGVVSSFDPTGFTTDVQTNISNGNIGRSGVDYAAWNWKGGGLINKSADFNGSSSYIYNAGLPLSGNTTISFWVKPEATQNQYANIIDYNHSSSGGLTIQQNSNNTNQYSLAVNNSGSFNSTGYFPLTANVWSNVVITLDSSGNANVIVNNNSVATGIGLLGLSSNALSIGRWISGNSRYFNGLIGQVRFFNQVLASSDITALYNETAADNSVLNYPQGAGCVAAYPLGENANDLSNTYNGTASNVTFGKPGYLTRNTEGTIESTVSTNVAAGFSIVSYTGNGNAGATVGHGIDTPELVIVKRLSGIENWAVYSAYSHPTVPQNYLLTLDNTSLAGLNSSRWNNTAPTNAVFSVGNSQAVNASANTYVAYCWHSVPGYSKIGSYLGNGNTTGPIIDLGFEPAWLMFKCVTQVGNWVIIDNKRATSNPRTPHLRANSTAQDDTGANEYVDFTSNGFQPKGVSNYNNNSSNQTYIYMAFAAS